MVYYLYSVQDDGSKILISEFQDLASAQTAIEDSGKYSIEQWDGNTATIIQ